MTATIEAHEKAYQRMWGEINSARRQRDRALGFIDAVRDLVIALEKDMNDGDTKVSIIAHDAFNRVRSRLSEYA